MEQVFYLIRHGITQGNLEHRYVGRIDEPLCVVGKNQLVQKISAGVYPSCDLVICSPMQRCTQTAELIYPKVPRVLCEDLKECNFGLFEGKTYEDLKENPDYQCFLEQNGEGDIPGGENSLDFRKRCCQAFLEMIPTILQKTAIISHGGVIMALLSGLSEHPLGFYEYQLPNCEGFTAVFDTECRRFIDCRRMELPDNFGRLSSKEKETEI